MDDLLNAFQGILQSQFEHEGGGIIHAGNVAADLSSELLAKAEKYYGQKIEDAKAHGLEAGAINERVRIAKEIETGLSDVFATTPSPNPAFTDGSQEPLYADRMFKLQQFIAKLGQVLKDGK